jgi:predicted nucleotidyltransferase
MRSVQPLADEIASVPYPVVYATLVGDRLYGTPGDDLDLRSCHVLAARDVLGLRGPVDSFARTVHRDGIDFEFCSHDLKKVAMMLLKKNGCIAEQILSPHVIATSAAHEELKRIVPLCFSRHWAHHFASQARLQDQVGKELYARRLLMSGIHLMRSSEFVMDYKTLTELVPDPSQDLLADAARNSPLPPMPGDEARQRLDDLLVRLRLDGEPAN